MSRRILIVTSFSASRYSALVAAWRAGAALAGCAVEHLVWVSKPQEFNPSCVECQLAQQCVQADYVALTVKRIMAADAVVFMVDEAHASEDSPLLSLLCACQEKMAEWKAPRCLRIFSPASCMSPADNERLRKMAVALLPLAWSQVDPTSAGATEKFMQEQGQLAAESLRANKAP